MIFSLSHFEHDVDGVCLTPLLEIPTPGGSVRKFLNEKSQSYSGFGEVYFSSITFNAVKAWKKHRLMTLNLVVPVGMVRFVVWNRINNTFFFEDIGQENYQLLTLRPGIWFGFKGLSKEPSLVVNFANIPHSDTECDQAEKSSAVYEW